MTDIELPSLVDHINVTCIRSSFNLLTEYKNRVLKAVDMNSVNLSDTIALLNYPQVFYMQCDFENYFLKCFEFILTVIEFEGDEKFLWETKEKIMNEIYSEIKTILHLILDSLTLKEHMTERNIRFLELFHTTLENKMYNELLQPIGPELEMKFRTFENELIAFKLSI